MAYTKTTITIPALADTLATIAGDTGILLATQTALLSAGSTATLDSGDGVWVSCVAQDNPETTAIEFVAVCIAGDANGVRLNPSLTPVSVRFIHGVSPDLVAAHGMDAIRKDLMLVALGEAPTLEWIAPITAERSIRTAITVADQFGQTPGDVL